MSRMGRAAAAEAVLPNASDLPVLECTLVLGGMPYHSRPHPGAVRALWGTATRWPDAVKVIPNEEKGSILPDTFNKIWCNVLEARRSRGVTRFFMIHDDIEPEYFFLDKLLGIQKDTGADVVAVVVPIKTVHGVTSTAVARSGDDESAVFRRLTLKEVFQLPETFTGEDVQRTFGHGSVLLPNTGLWLADTSGDWVEQISFRFTTSIQKVGGRYLRHCVPEDWHFGLDLMRLGRKVVCTRAVKLNHHGGDCGVVTNAFAWGSWETDEEYEKLVSAGLA